MRTIYLKNLLWLVSLPKLFLLHLGSSEEIQNSKAFRNREHGSHASRRSALIVNAHTHSLACPFVNNLLDSPG